MVRTFIWTTALLLTASTVASAQMPKQPPPVNSPSLLGQGDAQERAACHPDVVRYCKELIKDNDNSDVFAILSCLKSNRSKISQACNQVLASRGQ